jgi:hypothetical protein
MRNLKGRSAPALSFTRLFFDRIEIFIVIFVFFSGTAAAQTTSVNAPTETASPQDTANTEARQHYLVALEAMRNNDLPVALAELKQAAGRAPDNALVWYNLALVEFKSGKPKDAHDHFAKATGLGIPDNLKEDSEHLGAQIEYALQKQKSQQSSVEKDKWLQRLLVAGNNAASWKCGDFSKDPATLGLGSAKEYSFTVRNSDLTRRADVAVTYQEITRTNMPDTQYEFYNSDIYDIKFSEIDVESIEVQDAEPLECPQGFGPAVTRKTKVTVYAQDGRSIAHWWHYEGSKANKGLVHKDPPVDRDKGPEPGVVIYFDDRSRADAFAAALAKLAKSGGSSHRNPQ